MGTDDERMGYFAEIHEYTVLQHVTRASEAIGVAFARDT